MHEAAWRLETEHRPLKFGEKDTAGGLLDLALQMLAVLYAGADPAVEIVAVEQPFAVPLVNQETGEVLDRDVVGSVDLVERDAEGHLVVVDLKTSARRYTDLQVDFSLQLSAYSYATTMNGFANQADLKLGSTC